MKKTLSISALVFSLAIIFFQCNNSAEKKHLSTQSTQATTVVVDMVIKNKLRVAFQLVKKYSQESKVLHKNFSSRFIHIWGELNFGTALLVKENYYDFRPEKMNRENDLYIYLVSSLNGAAETLQLGEARQAIIMSEAFVRENSTEIVASVLLHELTHWGMNVQALEQGTVQNIPHDEFIAYSAQRKFLVYCYAGIETEVKFDQGIGVDVDVPHSDTSEFNYYARQQKIYRSLQ